MFSLILISAMVLIIWTILCTVCALGESKNFGRALVRNLFTAKGLRELL